MAGLTWYDTILQTGIGISLEDAANGWPHRMFVWRVAQLQRPSLSEDKCALAAKLAIHYALSDAVNDGSVPSVQQALRLEFSGKKRDIHGNTYGQSAACPEVADVLERFVTAADVVAWLAGLGEAPSSFIEAWHSATTEAGATPFPLADFAALVAYRKEQKAANVAVGRPQKNIPWKDGNQLDVLHAEYERQGKNTGTAESMAKAIGITRQAVEAALEKPRKRSSATIWEQLGAA